jgi:hypothetical protein
MRITQHFEILVLTSRNRKYERSVAAFEIRTQLRSNLWLDYA